tara:strand:- start:4803 stop:5717 length:915 start_codon:yes stop_codon:yes gene_type:complete
MSEEEIWELQANLLDLLENMFKSLYVDLTLQHSHLTNRIIQIIRKALGICEEVLFFSDETDSETQSIAVQFQDCVFIQKGSDEVWQKCVNQIYGHDPARVHRIPDDFTAPWISPQHDNQLWVESWSSLLKKYRLWCEDLRKEKQGTVFTQADPHFLQEELGKLFEAYQLLRVCTRWILDQSGDKPIGVVTLLVPPIFYNPAQRTIIWHTEKLGKALRVDAALHSVLLLMIHKGEQDDPHVRKVTFDHLRAWRKPNGQKLFVQDDDTSLREGLKDDVHEWNKKFKKKGCTVFHQAGTNIEMRIEH